MKVFDGFKPVHNGKRMDFLLEASLPTELSVLTTNSLKKFDYATQMYNDVNVHKKQQM